MVDMVKFGGGKKIVQMPKMGGKTAAHTYWLPGHRIPIQISLKFDPRSLIDNKVV